MNKSSAVVAVASVGVGAGGSVNAYSDTADEAVIGHVGGGADIADSCNVDQRLPLPGPSLSALHLKLK